MTLSTQWMTLGMMLGSGWLMGMLLDTYRIMARRFRLRGWVISLVDLLYWTAAAGIVFGLLMWSNWGELRFTVFVAVVMGWLAYHAWFSPAVTRVIQWGLRLVEYTIHLSLRVLYLTLWVPLATLWSLILRLLLLVTALFRGILRILLRLLAPVGRLFAPFGRRIRDWAEPVWRPALKGIHILIRLFKRRDNNGDE
ncbi:spore cortex biosynthesis protein YabQ [Salinithrix halophila]|uniref:Spore cortex biosynthesis protein YabQ n=1 Tax=Salinithrix halophila TaxID=1485204 RepID=A0ABV8JAZ3_9BACL